MQGDFRITHGNEAITMAGNMIDELNGINQMKVMDWFEIEDIIEKCSVPHRKSLLHNYIEEVYYFGLEYILDKHFPMSVINNLIELLEFYNVTYSSLKEFSLVGKEDEELNEKEFEEAEEFAQDLFELYQEQLMPYVVEDIFTVLYSNKIFLYEFNTQLSESIKKLKTEKYPELLSKDGVLKRCKYIPQWLKYGVFHRDKGRCQICGTDLTKILNLDNKENYDHIIPLENGGTNDPTNFQLTCEHCNKSKGARSNEFNNIASRFWELESYKMFDE